MAIITRCCWPPESWWGKAAALLCGSGRPTSVKASCTRHATSAFGRLRWAVIASAICAPIRIEGLRLPIASWKTMPMRAPRRARQARSDAPSISTPSILRLPESCAADGASPAMPSAVSDLPEPLSPTSAKVSPGWSVREMPSTAVVSPKRTLKSRRATSGTPFIGAALGLGCVGSHRSPSSPSRRRPRIPAPQPG